VGAAALLVFSQAAGGLTLEKCIREALAGNPDVRAAAHRAAAARAALEQARSAYYPRIALAGAYTRTDNPTQAFMMELNQRRLDMADPAFDPNEPDDTENLRVSATVRYRLYDGGRRALQADAAERGGAAAEAQRDAVLNRLVHDVTAGFYTVLRAAAFVDVQDKTVASLEENLRVARERFDAGSAVKTDVLNIEVELAAAREQRIRADNGAKLAVAALNTAVGRDLVTAETMPEAPEGPALDAPPAWQDLDVEQRPELRAAENAVEIARSLYRQAVRRFAPAVNAFGSYDMDSDAGSGFEESYLVGVAAEWDLFTGFERSASIDGAREAWRAAERDRDAIANRLRLDLRQAHLGAAEAWERLQVARKSVESAEEALRITRGRYQEGAADITELLMAQVAETASRTRRVAAYYDYRISLSNIGRAKGSLVRQWQ
jgi:outer membrane protein TolC